MDNNNKELISNEIENLLTQWQKTDRENRSVIVIASEKRGGGHDIESFICGHGGMLIDSILGTIRDKDAENSLATLMRRAIFLSHIEDTCDNLEHFTKVLEDMMIGKEGEQ